MGNKALLRLKYKLRRDVQMRREMVYVYEVYKEKSFTKAAEKLLSLSLLLVQW